MKKQFPEVEDLILATIDRIIGTSVFVKLDEYNNKEGVINFSEVAPGRIRNIRDYIKIGQKIVVKVIRVDESKNHIDLSLRRVTLKERKEISEKHKKQKDFFVMLNMALADKNKINLIKQKSKEYSLDEFFEALDKRNKTFFIQMGIANEEIKKVFDVLDEKIKNKKVNIRAKFMLRCDLPNGIERIKGVLGDVNAPGINITYLGAPNYIIDLQGKDYKELNKKLKEIIESFEKKARENNCLFEVQD